MYPEAAKKIWQCFHGFYPNTYSKYSHFLPEHGKRCAWTAHPSAPSLRSKPAHPSPSSWRKVSQLNLEDVGALLRQQDRALLLLQPSRILCLCLDFFLNLKIKMKFCVYDIFYNFCLVFHLGLDKSAVHLSFEANNGRLFLRWEVVNALNWIPLPWQNKNTLLWCYNLCYSGRIGLG